VGYQVIRQPDGKLAVFSSYTDCWAVYDAEPSEVVEWFTGLAAKDARRDAQRVVDAVVEGDPWKVYYQFTMSFEEANAKSGEYGGEVLPAGEGTS
jgi:hypothetical protein